MYILKQRMPLKARSDWLLTLRISSAINRATGSTNENTLVVAGIKGLKSSFVCSIISLSSNILKHLYFHSVGGYSWILNIHHQAPE